jgi:hypothetical protein
MKYIGQILLLGLLSILVHAIEQVALSRISPFESLQEN